jgi:hypothetical protein
MFIFHDDNYVYLYDDHHQIVNGDAETFPRRAGWTPPTGDASTTHGGRVETGSPPHRNCHNPAAVSTNAASLTAYYVRNRQALQAQWTIYL